MVSAIFIGCQSTVEVQNRAVASADSALILATTTSTYDSGLLDAILPGFESQHGIPVSVLAVGTGQALKLGEDGNADVVLVHACSREIAFMDAGHGVRRHQVMANDFVIVGSSTDPAGIEGYTDAVAALEAIARNEAYFVSRGDDSGTHIKEKSLWSEASIKPEGDWYLSAGQGMSAVLTIANERQAYALSDRSTYLKRRLQGLDLVILVSGDVRLANPYSVMTVNPQKGDHIKSEQSNQFADWLLSAPTQQLIADYGVKEFGSSLFWPTAAEPMQTECAH